MKKLVLYILLACTSSWAITNWNVSATYTIVSSNLISYVSNYFNFTTAPAYNTPTYNSIPVTGMYYASSFVTNGCQIFYKHSGINMQIWRGTGGQGQWYLTRSNYFTEDLISPKAWYCDSGNQIEGPYSPLNGGTSPTLGHGAVYSINKSTNTTILTNSNFVVVEFVGSKVAGGGLDDTNVIWVSQASASANPNGSMGSPYYDIPTLDINAHGGGKTYMVLPGTYMLTNCIYVTNGPVSIIGINRPKISLDNLNEAAVTVTPYGKLLLQGFEIIGGNLAGDYVQSGIFQQEGVTDDPTPILPSNFLIKDCYFNGTTSSWAVSVIDSAVIEDCVFDNMITYYWINNLGQLLDAYIKNTIFSNMFPCDFDYEYINSYSIDSCLFQDISKLSGIPLLISTEFNTVINSKFIRCNSSLLILTSTIRDCYFEDCTGIADLGLLYAGSFARDSLADSMFVRCGANAVVLQSFARTNVAGEIVLSRLPIMHGCTFIDSSYISVPSSGYRTVVTNSVLYNNITNNVYLP